MPEGSSDMGVDDVAAVFRNVLMSEPQLATAVAAMKTLNVVLEKCRASTLQELLKLLSQACVRMKAARLDENCCPSVLSVQSGCELFMRHITLESSLETGTFEEMRAVLLAKGRAFLEETSTARAKKILVHSRSRTVLAVLLEAHNGLNGRFQVYITQSSAEPRDGSPQDMVAALEKSGIPCTIIRDAAVGYVMGDVDFVMVGAEGVAESGGIINKIGTYTVAICAKELNKPVYVMCESFKFVRIYPLNQKDLPDEFKYLASTIAEEKDLSKVHPLVDYTPPAYLTLLFTDRGILTPSAVISELFTLYL